VLVKSRCGEIETDPTQKKKMVRDFFWIGSREVWLREIQNKRRGIKIYKSMQPFFFPLDFDMAAFVAVWNTSCTPCFSFAEHSR